MKRFFTLILFFVLLSLQIQASDSWIIYPGYGVGWIRLGTTSLSDIAKSLGEPDVINKNSDTLDISYTKYGFHFIFNIKTNKLLCIDIVAGNYVTAEGIGLGSLMSDVKKIYPGGTIGHPGNKNDSSAYGFRKIGLYFRENSKGKIFIIRLIIP